VSKPNPHSKRLRTTRKPKSARYDRETIDAILDEAIVAHVGFVRDDYPVVIPTLHARDGDRLLLHGSAAGKMLRHLAGGVEICVEVTILDGLVLARSAFEQNVNYRSVVIFGTAVPIEGEEAKLAALEALTNQLIPNRWAECRPPSRQELKGTSILELPLDEASAKLRDGGPTDAEGDLELPHWAGEVPRRVVWGPPLAEPDLAPGVDVPASVGAYTRPGS
jgi:nitroimidazol reductase NimA-like FMN-containing flavoprotein (pyridoxamine 5'-phosphate oxidase superfamily)